MAGITETPGIMETAVMAGITRNNRGSFVHGMLSALDSGIPCEATAIAEGSAAEVSQVLAGRRVTLAANKPSASRGAPMRSPRGLLFVEILVNHELNGRPVSLVANQPES